MRPVILMAFGLLVGCRSSTSGTPAPIPDFHKEALAAFIKYESCEPTTCDAIACETFSEGQTKGLPSRIARCRWTDNRTAISGTRKRCAYVHYSADEESGAVGNMFLSSRAFGDTCEPDKEFSDLVKGSQGYSGRIP